MAQGGVTEKMSRHFAWHVRVPFGTANCCERPREVRPGPMHLR